MGQSLGLSERNHENCDFETSRKACEWDKSSTWKTQRLHPVWIKKYVLFSIL